MRSARPQALPMPSGPSALTAVVVMALATTAYLASSWVMSDIGTFFSSGRPDMFWLAEAFLDGRTWLAHALGPHDVVILDGRVYVPFGPGPALALVPLVAVVGRATAVLWEPLVNALFAGGGVALCWILAGRLGVARTSDRIWVVVLFGFSTATWWVTARGGVWHTAHLLASILTLLGLIEAFGRRRPLLLGLLAGAAFLTRAPLLFAVPFWAWSVLPRQGDRGWEGGRHPSPVRRLLLLAVGLAPGIAFALWYNAVRFGSPLESGYALATLPDWLADQRAKGLFSLVHLPMNIDYFLLKLPRFTTSFPWITPDRLGMSILFTSPGLLLAVRADWRERVSWALLGTAVLVLVPSLLYYGGGWVQFGYRYFLDSLPFVIALVALAAARVGVGWLWRAAIVFGVVVNLISVYWVYRL